MNLPSRKEVTSFLEKDDEHIALLFMASVYGHK
ncbi:hypothetical protein SAMN05444147_105319 [Pectobacterium carotovorum]|nr:hypothetical protein SAMN05444147_105319 [Pectobacterium carotovorum]